MGIELASVYLHGVKWWSVFSANEPCSIDSPQNIWIGSVWPRDRDWFCFLGRIQRFIFSRVRIMKYL